MSLADGRTLVAQVDGGNGHSGHRSPDLHFGLGAQEASRPVPVEIRWRGVDGAPHRGRLELVPGWQTVELTQEARLRAPRETSGR